MLEPVCTVSSLAAGEPTIGTAPQARAWICLEQSGPWGARALTESHLDPVLGARLEAAAAEAGVRPALIRRPGRHADDHAPHRPRLLVAHTDPADPWLYAGRLQSAADVLTLDLAGIAAGRRPEHPALSPLDGEVLLVCTNGARDTCCARFGRPVVTDAAAAFPERVWEVTHTSGHRLAPTTVLLPSGHLHGRVEDGSALLAAALTGKLVATGWRGRSTWPGPAQAAEELVRRTEHLTGLHDLSISATGPDAWLVRHRDGREWTVQVTATVGQERSESCGKPARPVVHHAALLVGSSR